MFSDQLTNSYFKTYLMVHVTIGIVVRLLPLSFTNWLTSFVLFDRNDNLILINKLLLSSTKRLSYIGEFSNNAFEMK